MSNFADTGCHVVSVTDPYGRILGSLDVKLSYIYHNSGQYLPSSLIFKTERFWDWILSLQEKVTKVGPIDRPLNHEIFCVLCTYLDIQEYKY
jgi:hypothetical protein